MRKIIKGLMALGLAALPSQVQAQTAQNLGQLPPIPVPIGRAMLGPIQPVSGNYGQQPQVLPPGSTYTVPPQPVVAQPVVPQPSASYPGTLRPFEYVPPYCDADTCCTPRAHCLHLQVFGEYLYWNVHNADVPFAQAFDGIDPATSVPRGPVGTASPKYESGFRFGGGVGLSDHSWVVGTFTYFHENTNGAITAPAGNVLHNFLVFPNTVNSAGDSLSATAQYVIDLRTADVDYKCAFVNNEHLSLLWVAGARYAHLNQSLLATYQVTGTSTTDATVNFDGGGVRAGLEGEYRILGGFYGYGKGMLDLLVGQFRGNFVERNVFTGLIGQSSITESRIVPVLELELGLGWQSKKGHVRISGGYYFGSWFNVMNVPSLGQAIANNNFTTNSNNFRDNLTFDGFVGHVEFRY